MLRILSKISSFIQHFLSFPIIRLYVRNNRLIFKLFCILVVSIDYQLLRYLLRYAVKFVDRRS